MFTQTWCYKIIAYSHVNNSIVSSDFTSKFLFQFVFYYIPFDFCSCLSPLVYTLFSIPVKGNVTVLDLSKVALCLYTGVAIEISLAKDRSLSVVITGKEEAVKVARKMVLQQLQTQVVMPRC